MTPKEKAMKTAVEWFFSELKKMDCFISNDMFAAYKQAKEMEKQQIIETWHNGYQAPIPMIDEENCGQQYYNVTFNK